MALLPSFFAFAQLAGCPLLLAGCWLPVASRRLPVACGYLPIAKSHQQSAKSHQQSAKSLISSIALNLSEGFGASGGNARIRFESALGSLNEAVTGVRIAQSWGYFPANAAVPLLQSMRELGARVSGLVRGAAAADCASACRLALTQRTR